MKEFHGFFAALAATPLAGSSLRLQGLMAEALAPSAHGDLPRWQRALAALPPLVPAHFDLAQDSVSIGEASDIDEMTRAALHDQLQAFHPWRKGPFNLFGLQIDTEWHSDWKWRRLAPRISPLKGRRILDVGCGNGYYALRMLGAGAGLVIGIDPTLLYFYQFRAIMLFLPELPVHVLPVPFEALDVVPAFDTVFSMGVLYHRRDPIEHLQRLRGMLVPGGELVLETLVIEGGADDVLIPKDRYARMRNVWAIPSVIAAEGWLREAGFGEIQCVDVSQTRVDEQRSTAWMRFESLADSLAGDRTVEGYPRPTRAVFIART